MFDLINFTFKLLIRGNLKKKFIFTFFYYVYWITTHYSISH